VLQGGGALGAYQAGVYEGMHEAGIRPNWLAGISIVTGSTSGIGLGIARALAGQITGTTVAVDGAWTAQ